MRAFGRLVVASTLLATGLFARAESLDVQATMVTQEQVELDFKDGSGHSDGQLAPQQ